MNILIIVKMIGVGIRSILKVKYFGLIKLIIKGDLLGIIVV
jgi:hypothetical protein